MQELRPWIGKAPITEPPSISGYRLLRGEQLDIMRASLLGVLLVPPWWIIYVAATRILGGEGPSGVTISILNIVVGIMFALLLVSLHELLHGVAVLLTGNIPSFGIGPGFAYTTCHAPLTRNAYLLVVVLPLIVINAAALIAGAVWPGAANWALFLSIINTMGAGGDIWMIIRLLNVARSSLIIDLASGFAVYAPDQATTASPTDV